jgi:SPP1 gp7 family putative phage head morphogenesis protein
MTNQERARKNSMINAKRFEKLMKDIEKDVVSRTRNSKDLATTLDKLGAYISTNVFNTGGLHHDKIVVLIESILQNAKFKGLAQGGTAELVKGVISENTMHYVTNMGEDMKNNLRKIVVDSYNKNLSPLEISKRLQKEVAGLSKVRAKVIARTETMRANNLSNYTNAKLNMGAKSYKVISAPGCCHRCEEIYKNGSVWFDIDDMTYFPPLHPNCRCVGAYSTKTSLENNANDYQTNRREVEHNYNTRDNSLEEELRNQLAGYENKIRFNGNENNKEIKYSSQRLQNFNKFKYSPNGNFGSIDDTVEILVPNVYDKSRTVSNLKWAIDNYDELAPNFKTSLEKVIMAMNPIRNRNHYVLGYTPRGTKDIYLFSDFIRNNSEIMKSTFVHEVAHLEERVGDNFIRSSSEFKDLFMKNAKKELMDNNIDIYNKFKRATEDRVVERGFDISDEKIKKLFSSDYGYDSWVDYVTRNPNFHGGAFSEEYADSVAATITNNIENRVVKENIKDYIINVVWK